MKEIIQTYLNSFKRICPELTDKELELVKEKVTVTEFKSKAFYLKKGKIQKEIGYVYKGLLRIYYIDEHGNDKTVRFVKENEYVTEYSAFIKQKPLNYYMQCIEPSIIVNLPYATIQNGYLKYKNFEKYGRLVAERILVARQNRLESFIFENAEQRYNNFIKENPGLFNRISLTHLSSYLGIQRQSLSRIRKNK